MLRTHFARCRDRLASAAQQTARWAKASAMIAIAALSASVQRLHRPRRFPTRPSDSRWARPPAAAPTSSRACWRQVQRALGQPFVVENRPGASNTIAADFTAKAAPDGHTLLVATNTGQAIAPHLMKLSFDTIKDLMPVALMWWCRTC